VALDRVELVRLDRVEAVLSVELDGLDGVLTVESDVALDSVLELNVLSDVALLTLDQLCCDCVESVLRVDGLDGVDALDNVLAVELESDELLLLAEDADVVEAVLLDSVDGVDSLDTSAPSS